MANIKSYIHLAFLPTLNSISTEWGKCILNAVNEAYKKEKIKNNYPQENNALLCILLKLKMIQSLLTNLKTNGDTCLAVAKQALKQNSECEFNEKNNHDGFALKLPDEKIKYDLLLGIDSLFFELDSCWELIIKFSETVYSLAEKQFNKTDIIDILSHHANQKYYKLLSEYRNFFIHEATPYLAIDTTNYNQWNLLVIHDHNQKLTEENTIPLKDIDSIINVFYKNIEVLQQHLIKLFN